MNIIKQHIEYLRDNPEGYWFKRKLYGWGWTPASWQGWLVVFSYVIAMVLIILRAEESIQSGMLLQRVILPATILTLLFDPSQ